MAIRLIANYSKRLGLPGYSSHQFSISIETELVTTDDVPAESQRIYHLLQTNVDGQILQTGFVPPAHYGMDAPAANSCPGNQPAEPTNIASWRRGPAWKCSDKQRELILKLVEVRLDGLRVVAAYLDSPEAMKEKPRAVEVLLKEDIPGLSVPLTGAMDLVEGNYIPVDFKSAAAKPDPAHAAFDHEIQLVSYQLLMEAATGESPPSLDLVFLVKTKTPQVIRVPSPPADAHRKRRVIALLETAVEGIASNRFHPQPGIQCSWCQYRNECMAWLPGQLLPERKAA
jgi:hypothetical protein